MKRIESACLLQQIRFDTYNDANPEKEFKAYCERLDKTNTKYEIESKEVLENGTWIVKIKKQYNKYKTDGYMD